MAGRERLYPRRHGGDWGLLEAVWHILSPSDFTLILAHAAHVKNGPGGKTDVADALWLADLLAHGLIGPSFVPDLATQEMPGLLRTRQQLVREQASHLQRIQKVLEEANVKLASVLTDIMGLSGRAVLAALIAAETDPDRLLGLIDRRVKAPAEKLRPALQGRITDRHRFLLRLHLRQIDALRDAIAAIDQEVDREIAPFRDAIRPLRSIPGVGDLSAQIIISEIGIDMGRFPDAAHRIAWAGLCPRSDESAGKRRSTRLRKGGPWLKTTVIQCAWSAVKQRSSYLHAQFQRLRQRRGPKKAICAVAGSILTAIFHMLRDGTFYRDLGPDYLSKHAPLAYAKKLAQKITRLGFSCTLTPQTAGP